MSAFHQLPLFRARARSAAAVPRHDSVQPAQYEIRASLIGSVVGLSGIFAPMIPRACVVFLHVAAVTVRSMESQLL